MKKEKIEKWILKAENDLKIAKDEILIENPATESHLKKNEINRTS